MTLRALTRDNQIMETEKRTSHHYSSKQNQENVNTKVRKKKNQDNHHKLTPEEKAEKKKLCCRLRLLNETPEQRELRLKRLREYKESRTPEQKKASKLKNALYTRRYREEQLNLAKTPEEKEALLLQRKEYSRNYREKIKSLAKTPEQKEALRLKIVNEKRKSVEKLKKLPNRDNMGKICTPEPELHSDEEEKLLCVMTKKRSRRKRSGQVTAPSRIEKQTSPDVMLPLDKIKVEKEVLQETTINTIPVQINANKLPYASLYDSPWSSFESSNKKFTTNDTTKLQRYFHSVNRWSTSEPKTFPTISSQFTKIDRRKTWIQESFSSMRDLIDVSRKRDEFETFGKCICQKLRRSKRDIVEVNFAKQLIDNILHNLATGVYKSEARV